MAIKTNGWFSEDILGLLIKSVLKALTLIDITATAMFCLYSTMHATTMGPHTVLEHWIISSFVRLAIAFMNILGLKLPISGKRLFALSLCFVPFLFVYDAYMLQLVTSNKTYLITTIAMKTIFIALDLVLLVVLFYIIVHPDAFWRAYMDTHDAVYDALWDLKLEHINASGYKDRHMMGLFATALPVHATALAFYIMSQLSNGKTEVSGYFFFYDIVVLVLVSEWFGTPVDDKDARSVQHILQCYVNTGIVIFVGFILYVFQLTLVPIDFFSLVLMRMVLLLISGIYLSAFIVKNYDSAFAGLDRSYVMYLVISFGFFSLASFEFFSMIAYTLYSSVVRNQHLIVSNYFHVLTSSFAIVVFLIGEGDSDSDKWRMFAGAFNAGSITVWCNALLVASVFTLYSDTIAIGIFPSQPYRTTSEFWIQVGFVVTSAAYVLMSIVIYPVYSRKVFVQEYRLFLDMMQDKFTYHVLVANNSAILRINFIMRRMVLFVSFAEYVFATYFVYCLVDVRMSILGHIMHAHDWAIVVHYLTIVFAWLTSAMVMASIVYIDIRAQCGLVMASATTCFVFDVSLLIASVMQSHPQPESLLVIRMLLLMIDAVYIALCAYALTGTDDDAIAEKEEKEKESKDR